MTTQLESPEKKGKVIVSSEEGTVRVHCKEFKVIDAERAEFTIDETVLSKYKKLLFKIGKKTITYEQTSIE